MTTTKTNMQEPYNQSEKGALLCGGLAQEILQAASSIEIASEFLEKNTRHMFAPSKQETAGICFDALSDSVLQLTRVAENLSDLLANRDAVLEAKMQPIDLHWQFDRIVKKIMLNKRATGIKIVPRFRENAFVFVPADPVFADKVFLNLLSNAMQSGAEKPVVHVSLVKEDDYLILTIDDNGLGIEPKVMQHLFEPFCGGYSATRGRRGSGLGLYLANEYCKSMGWTLGLQTGAAGTVATVKIPTDYIVPDDTLQSLSRNLGFCSAQDRRIQIEMSIL